jgi:TonB family protein
MRFSARRARLFAGFASILIGATDAAIGDAPKAVPPSCSSERVPEGCGTFRLPDGTNYTGGFHGGFPYGPAVISFADGSQLEGDIRGSAAAGPVTYTDAHGLSAHGEYKPPSPDRAHPHPPIQFPAWRAFFGDSASLVVDAVVDEKGNVISAAVDQPTGKSFDRAAVDAVMTWRYAPATVGGQPVKDLINVQIQFASTSASAGVQDQAGPVFGAGQKRCSAWTEHRNDGDHGQYVQWLLGFLSGASSDLGGDASEEGLTGRMDAYCRTHPLESISAAARQMVIEQVHGAESLKLQHEWIDKFIHPDSSQHTTP